MEEPEQLTIQWKLFPPCNNIHVMVQRQFNYPCWVICLINEISCDFCTHEIVQEHLSIDELSIINASFNNITFSNGISIELSHTNKQAQYLARTFIGQLIDQLYRQNKLIINTTNSYSNEENYDSIVVFELPNGHICSLYAEIYYDKIKVSVINHTTMHTYKRTIRECNIAPDDDIHTIIQIIHSRILDGTIGNNIKMQENALIIDISDGILINEHLENDELSDDRIFLFHLYELFENEHLTFVEDIDLCFK